MQNTYTSTPVARLLFLLTLVWGVAIFWIAPRAPLIDLPQHVGQVSLWRDILAGVSPWSDIFRLNLWTPYLIGYGLALPLSFIMPAGTAVMVVLSVAYIAFVLLGSRLRAHFGADPRLDWLFFPTFFGFAYNWGFYTFLVAAPVVLYYILVVDRYSQQPSVKRGILATVVGIVLLLSHGLAFAFGGLVAGCLYTIRCYTGGGQWMKRWLQGVWPLVIAAAACVSLYLISVRIQSEYWAHGALAFSGDYSIMRIPRMMANAVGDYYTPKMILLVVMLVLFAVPFLLGLRLNRRNPAVWVFFAIVLAIQLFVPSTFIATAYVYQRFALYVLPAYALIFMAATTVRPAAASVTAGAEPAPKAERSKTIPMLLMMAGIWTIFAVHSVEMWKFAQESKDFDAVMSKMESKQRVLALTFDSRSDEANLDLAYRHYVTWYQAEKQGLVDFNFAWFPPQVVRFKPDRLPKVMEGLKGQTFTVQKYPLDPYRYIVARHTEPLPADLFKGAPCAPRKLVESGTWTLFEHGDCRVAQGDGNEREPAQG